MHTFMTHLVQRSLGTSPALRPRPVTPFEHDTLKASFEIARESTDRRRETVFGPSAHPAVSAGDYRVAATPEQPVRVSPATVCAPNLPPGIEPAAEGSLPDRQKTTASHPPASEAATGGPRSKSLVEQAERESLRAPMAGASLAGLQRAGENVPAIQTGGVETRRAFSVRPQAAETQTALADFDMASLHRARRWSPTSAPEVNATRWGTDEPGQLAADESPFTGRTRPPLVPRRETPSRSPTTPTTPKTVPVASAPPSAPQVSGPAYPQPIASRLSARDSARMSMAQTEPVIQVTIGRVEIRAVTPTAGKTDKPQAPAKPTLSLGDYLDRRSGGRK